MSSALSLMLLYSLFFHKAEPIWNKFKEKKIISCISYTFFQHSEGSETQCVSECVLLDWFAFIETLHIKWLLLPHKSSLTSNNNILHLWKVLDANVCEWSCGNILRNCKKPGDSQTCATRQWSWVTLISLSTCHCQAVDVYCCSR